MATYLIIWLSVSLVIVSAQVKDQFIYNGFNETQLLNTDGIAQILPSGLLELTNASINKLGHAFYKFPLPFGSSPSSFSFSTTFVIAIVREGNSNTSGHGMAFVVSSSNNFSNAYPNHYLGLFNTSTARNNLLAIEFDTVRSFEDNDIDDNHVGIDVNSLESIAAATAAYFSNDEGRNKSLRLNGNYPIQVWIDFDGSDLLLNVTIAPITSQRPKVPLLSRLVNVSEVFLDHMFVGFSAATGTVVGHHYVLGWSLNKNGKAQDLDIAKLPLLPPRPHHRSILVIIFPMAMGILMVLVVGGVCFYRNMKYREVFDDWEKEYSPQRYSFKKLYKATKGFNRKELIGEGGFGQVYRGNLPTKVEIAVKRVSHDSKQGMKEFVTEIVSMKRLRHKNLVQLLGYCRRKGELLLVYEYMPNGSLEKLLYSYDQDEILDWSQRFHIIKGVASALLYLHEDWEQVVLHRDIKSSNVLLDADLNGRLGDFGLAKFHDHGNDAHATRLVGTIGYMAPELCRSGIPTKGTDVYAFGAFMLEVVCGKRPIESPGQPDEVVLVESVIQFWKMGELARVIDPNLEGIYVVEEMELVLKLGMLCHSGSDKRPSMRQLMQYLDGNAKLLDFLPEEAGISDSRVRHEASDMLMRSIASSSHSTYTTNESILMAGR